MKILVIDDDYLIRYTLARLLRGNGHEVATAADGRRGMTVFRTYSPDIVITDIIMPEQGGYETIRQIRSERATTRIIAISGHSGDDALALARELGADAVFRKPLNLLKLSQRVTQLEAAVEHETAN